jgi:hypothetical protein
MDLRGDPAADEVDAPSSFSVATEAADVAAAAEKSSKLQNKKRHSVVSTQRTKTFVQFSVRKFAIRRNGYFAVFFTVYDLTISIQ